MTLVSFPDFPNSSIQPFLITSPDTPAYNCIAWAFEDPSRWYWPDPANIYYWPNNVPRNVTLDSFIALFATIRYELCQDGEIEIGYNKIAIFVDTNGTPTHAARQLPDGFWTSKLGQNIDVQHTIFSIQDGGYGTVAAYMRRTI
jgi:hypothetical protein